MVERIKSGPFKGLLKNHYGVLLIDPPWSFLTYSEKGMGRSADTHYETMSLDDIKALPIADLMDKDCAVFLWITDPLLFEGINVLKQWGCVYKTVGFYWVKLNKDLKTPFTGLGHWTRSNVEQCLLATRGHPKRIGKGVPKLIAAPRREHSRKPDEIFPRIESLLGDVPRLELFSRQKRPGWDCWGAETTKFPAIPHDDVEDLIG